MEINLRRDLPIDESFDVIERIVSIGGRTAKLYFIDGFIKDEVMQRILTDFFKISQEEMENISDGQQFSKEKVPYVEVALEKNQKKAADAVLAGQTAMVIEGYEEIILMDLRTYPVRGVSEPEKEKTLRGSRDGLVETIIFNTAMVRRRIRDARLVFAMYSVGNESKTDVCIGYMKGLVDEELLDRLQRHIQTLKIDNLTVGDQSLVEALNPKKNKKVGLGSLLNPFPKVRYTERPDVVAAHITEGKFVILVDNSPTAMILPTGFFDFLQDVDDYSFPVMTGNYFRLVRGCTMGIATFITPLYLLLATGACNGWFYVETTPLSFALPKESFAVPLFWQFLLLELAIDGLKLASLNTPSSLGMSLSVIGALILGEFSVTAGWLIPQTILLMAVVALAGFTQPSIELSYALKFMRMGLLVGATMGIGGFLVAFMLELTVLVSTKTITGTSYLYPLIPFHGRKLARLLFRKGRR